MSHNSPLNYIAGIAAAMTLAASAQTPGPVPVMPIPIALPPPLIPRPLSPVIAGSATLNQGGNISLGAGSGAIVNWNKFNIAAGGTVQVHQPAASSAVLNQVLNRLTAINDPIGSNGRVVLLNPSGVVQLGEIKTSAGSSVYLTGATETNKGIITTPKGQTILATGATVGLIDSTTPGIKVEITGAKGNATNLGAIMAEVGRVGIAGAMVRDNTRLNVASVVNEGGRIFLQAGPNGRAPN